MKQHKGFTIIELLIVIVIVAVLASITLVAYNGVKNRAQMAQIDSDIQTLSKAIRLARIASDQSMVQVTGVEHTGADCAALPSGTDIKNLSKTHTCWTNYATALNNISNKSGVNVRNMLDPWGRPYYMYEGEDTYVYSVSQPCKKDDIGVLRYPHVEWSALKTISIERYRVPAGC